MERSCKFIFYVDACISQFIAARNCATDANSFRSWSLVFFFAIIRCQIFSNASLETILSNIRSIWSLLRGQVMSLGLRPTFIGSSGCMTSFTCVLISSVRWALRFGQLNSGDTGISAMRSLHSFVYVVSLLYMLSEYGQYIRHSAAVAERRVYGKSDRSSPAPWDSPRRGSYRNATTWCGFSPHPHGCAACTWSQGSARGHVTRVLLILSLQRCYQIHHIEVIPLVKTLTQPIQIGKSHHQRIVLFTRPNVLQQHSNGALVRMGTISKEHVRHFI